MISLNKSIEPIRIGDLNIYKTRFFKPYLIAEIGVNYYDIAEKHKISIIDAAKLMIDKAKSAGCNAVKFQTYKAKRLASKYATAFWNKTIIKENNQIELYKKYDKLNKEDYIELHNHAKRIDLEFITTLFDEDLVDELDEFLNSYKIAALI